MTRQQFKANAQCGFALVEMLVAIAISGLIVAVIVEVTAQTFIISAADNSRMAAVKQVENAIHWIERDGQMASRTSISPDDSAVTDFPLYLQWTGFEDNYTHSVTYALDGDVLRRREVIEDIDEEPISDSETLICENIVAADSSYSFNGEILKVNLTATVDGFRSATESRTLYVIPRVEG